MKIKFHCWKCLEENFGNMNLSFHHDETPKDISNDYFYDFTCINGHKNHFVVSNHKYELLFDSGIYALNDGYYREAVADFAASLERFYEICIRIILIECTKNGTDSFDVLWNEIARQSERQYGAFLALYTSFMGKSPEKQNENMVAFRNKVIHKGEFPSKEETIKYAKYVAERIKNIYSALDGKVNMRLTSLLIIAQTVFKDKKNHYSSTHLPTFLSQYIPSEKIFDENLSGFLSNSRVFYLK